MGLDKATLKASIKAVLLSRFPGTPTATQQSEMDSLAGGIADAIDIYVKGASVIYVPNLTSATGGPVSAITPANPIATLQ